MTNKNLRDIPPFLHPLTEKWDTEMIRVVLQAGLAREAAEILTKAAGPHNPKLHHAIKTLVVSINLSGEALLRAKGWKREDLWEVEKEIELKWKEQNRILDKEGNVLH